MMSKESPAESALEGRPQADARSGERGMVLIMAMLMVTLLTMLGSAAVLRTSMSMRDAGAWRVERAAYRISEAGSLASVALAAQMQGGFQDYVKERSGALSMADMGANLLDLGAKTGSFGNELVALGAADFATEVSEPDLSTSVPGFDAGKYCFQAYRITTTSRLGAKAPETVQEILTSGQAAIAAEMMVGPVPCAR